MRLAILLCHFSSYLFASNLVSCLVAEPYTSSTLGRLSCNNRAANPKDLSPRRTSARITDDSSSHQTGSDDESSSTLVFSSKATIQSRRPSHQQPADPAACSSCEGSNGADEARHAKSTTLSLSSRGSVAKRGLQAPATEQALHEKIREMRIKTTMSTRWRDKRLEVDRDWKWVPTEQALVYAKSRRNKLRVHRTKKGWKRYTAKRQGKHFEKMPSIAELPGEEPPSLRKPSSASARHIPPRGSFSNLGQQPLTGSERSESPNSSPQVRRGSEEGNGIEPSRSKPLSMKGKIPKSHSESKGLWKTKSLTPKRNQEKHYSKERSEQVCLARH